MNPIDQALDFFYLKVNEMSNKVLGIFNNFFGEERVDMQGFPSREGLRNFVLHMPISDILLYSGMYVKSPFMELSTDKTIAHTDFASLPKEDIHVLTEAVLSSSFIGYCKSRYARGFILVHFPRVTVTNEHNKSTVVKHIYVKVPLTIEGSEDGVFTMNRSEYTVAEISSNYMHSHASEIPTDNFERFVHCCLGSGPLVHTQSQLSAGFDEDRWSMFCLELSKYIEVESLIGTPYHRLECIGSGTSKVSIGMLVNQYVFLVRPHTSIRNKEKIKTTIKEFLSHYLRHNNLTFSYRNGVYSLGVPFIEYLIHISNSFIEYVNSIPGLADSGIENIGIIKRFIIRNGELYNSNTDLSTASYVETYRSYIGEQVCTFKGRPVTVAITDLKTPRTNTEHCARLIDINLASILLNRVLRTINYRYGRNQESPYSTIGKVRYEV